MPRLSDSLIKLNCLITSTGLGKDVSQHFLFAADHACMSDLHSIKPDGVELPVSSLITITTNYEEKSDASCKEKGFFQKAVRAMDFDFEVQVTVDKALLPSMSDDALAYDETFKFLCNYHKNEENADLNKLISDLENAVEKLNQQDGFICAYNQTIFAFNQQLAEMKRQHPASHQESTAYQTIIEAKEALKEAYLDYRDKGDLGVFNQAIQSSYNTLSAHKKHCRNVLIPLAILGALVFAAFVAAIVAAFILVPPGAGVGVGGIGLIAAAKTAAVATTATTVSSLGWLPMVSTFFGLIIASAGQLPWVYKMNEYRTLNKSLQALGTFKTAIEARNPSAQVIEPPATLLKP